MIRFLVFLLLFIFITICSHAQVDSSAIAKAWTTKHASMIWINGHVMIVSDVYPTVLDMKTIQGFQKKGSYVTAILKLPDSVKSYNIKVEATEVGTPIPPVIIITKQVDSEEGVIFSTGWTFHGTTAAAGWYKGTLAYSVLANSTATYTFTGRQVELFAEVKDTHGNGTIRIDGGPETPVSFKAIVQAMKLIYTSPVLTDGQHTVVLKVNGDGPGMLDYWKIYTKQ